MSDYAHVDATSAPYLISTLRPRSAWFDDYYAATRMGGLAARRTAWVAAATRSVSCSARSTSAREHSATTYSYSVLRTLHQDGFGLSGYLGSAAAVAPLPVVWN